MEEAAIKKILDSHEQLVFQIQQNDLHNAEKTAAYASLLAYVGMHPAYGKKFCGCWTLSFTPDCGTALWENTKAVQFVRNLGTQFPFLFYLAEKEGETLKLLVMLFCKSDKVEGDNLSLDRDIFNRFLKEQLKGILLMSEKVGLSPENAQVQMQSVYEYFGLAD